MTATRDAEIVAIPMPITFGHLDAIGTMPAYTCFCFGVDIVGTELRPAYADLLEYGDADDATAVLR